MQSDINSELTALRALSSRLGNDRLLAQAATGNTSVKCGDTLWIKASGKWLAHADREDAFIPVSLARVLECIGRGANPARAMEGASAETAMHAVLPFAVVLHLHSVNAIAWAVLRDRRELRSRMDGLDWRWIPYCPSGLPLAAEIGNGPAAHVLLLANHGLVVCGHDCDSAENLLREVERRLRIEPRALPWQSRVPEVSPPWGLPDDDGIHSLVLDDASRAIIDSGILYPCQAIFLSPEDVRFVDGQGVLIRRSACAVVGATLGGLAEVVRRIASPGQVRFLTAAELGELRSADVYRYRTLVEELVKQDWQGREPIESRLLIS